MRKTSAANNVASSPPVPARISNTTFLSSLGSLGSSRTLISCSMRASSGSRRAASSVAIWRRSGSCSCNIPRAWSSSLAAFFHSRYLSTTSAISLRALAALRYSAASAISAGSASWRVRSSKRTSICWSLGTNCMEVKPSLSDDQFAALGLFKGHGAFERVYGHGGLLVGRRLGGDALEPQAGGGEGGQERSAALGGEADQLVADARDEGQQQHAAEQFHAEAGKRNQCVNHHGDDHHHHQKTGAAAGMESGERLRVFDVDWFAGFEVEHHLVFGAVILEDAVDVFHPRNQEQKCQENRDADEAIGGVESDAALEHRVPFSEGGDGVQRHELVKENEKREGEEQVQTDGPTGDLLGCGFGRFGLQHGVGREFQRPQTQRHRLTEGADAAQDRVFEDAVLLGHARQRLLLGDDLARRLADRDTIAVRGAHHDALDYGLAADQRFLAAFEDGHHLDMREKTKEGTQGHNSSQSGPSYYSSGAVIAVL